MGGITNKYLAKLAEGRTEITTDMICEAERLAYQDNLGCGLMSYYTNGLQAMTSEEMQRAWQQQMLGMAQAQRMNPYTQHIGDLGAWIGAASFCSLQYHIANRCPYCGK